MVNKNIKQLTTIFVVFALILLLSIMVMEKLFFEKSVQRVALQNAVNRLKERESVIKSFLEQSNADLIAIRESLFFKEYLKSNKNRELLENMFLIYAKANKNFMQIRFIDKDGKERIRVDRNRCGDQAYLVSKDKLQNKSNRYYFADSKSKELGKVWFSAIDLNIEHGKIEIPYKPTFRAVLPIKYNNEFYGILIINYLMKDFIENLTNTPLYDAIIFNDKGYTIFHYSHKDNECSEKCWGNSLSHKYNIASEFPNDYKNILFLPFLKTNTFVSKKFGFPIYGGVNFILQLKKSYLIQEQQKFKIHYSIVLIVVFILSLILTYFIIKIFSRTLFNLDKVQNLNENLNSLQLRNDIAMKASQIGIWEWNYETNTLVWDEHMYEMYGVKKEKDTLDYIMWSNIIDPNDVERVERILNSAVLAGSDFNCNFWIITPKGKKYIKALGVNEFDVSGKAFRMIGTNQDMTKQKLLEKLKIDKETADKANAAKSEFLANMSHEIRTPLNGIIGLTELTLDTNLTDIQREYLIKARISSKSLLNVINDILDYSKIEAGKLSITNKKFRLDELLHEIAGMFNFQIDEKNLDFSYKIDPNIPNYLIGDSLRLTQIFNNLISNSLKFTHNGYIALEIDIINKSDREVTLQFCVEDSGIGISEEKQKKLFHAFEQGDSSITKEYGGTGLGLTITKQLIELMGGKIWFESQDGKGSQFYFNITFKFEDDEEQLDYTLWKNRKFLIVEDSDIERKYLSSILKSWKIDYIQATDGQEALEILKKQKFDYILLDWKMPRVDGLTLLEKLKVLNIKIPHIFMITAYHKNELLKDAQKKHISMDKVLEKPYTPSNLYNILFGRSDTEEFSKYTDYSTVLKETKKALLAEDNKINQLVAIKILENFGFETEIAENGLICTQMAQNKKYDIIFMDLQMPIMDGFSASKKIREFDKDIPIVALSAAVMQKDRELTKEAGMNHHMSKPIDRNELKNVISQYFEITFLKDDEDIIDTKEIISVEDIDIKLLKQELNVDLQELYFIYDGFRNTYQDKIDMLDISSDTDEFQKFIHQLKGASGNLKITKVYELAQKINSGNFNKDDVFELKNRLRDACNNIKEKITPLLESKDIIISIKEYNLLINDVIDKLKSHRYISAMQKEKLFSALELHEVGKNIVENVKNLFNKKDKNKLIIVLKELL